MSFDISAVGHAQGAAPTPPAAPPPATSGPDPVAPVPQEAVDVDTFPSSPPPEVSQAIAVAAQAFENLAAQGQRIHFAIDRPSGRLSAQLVDSGGSVLGTLTPSKVLEVAAGAGVS